MTIAHIFSTKLAANQALLEINNLPEIGVIKINDGTVCYNGVTLKFLSIDEIFQALNNERLDSVKYHDVELDDKMEEFLMERMNG